MKRIQIAKDWEKSFVKTEIKSKVFHIAQKAKELISYIAAKFVFFKNGLKLNLLQIA